MNPALQPINAIWLGQRAYQPVWQAMKAYTDERTDSSPDKIWCVEHPPVFTQGQAGKAEHVLLPGDIPVVQTDRGGQVTYHGPGQLVVYPLFDLKRLGIGPREMVTKLEESMIRWLSSFKITAVAKADAPGVYVDEAKIGSIGLRIRKGCSYHGISLNLNLDLEPFSRINPCGFQGLKMTRISDLAELPIKMTVETAAKEFLPYLCDSFSLTTASLINESRLDTLN